MRKGIDLDKKVVILLKKLAKEEHNKLKPYMEKVLIEKSLTAVRAVRQKDKK